MATFQNERFTNLDVVLDGNVYRRCTFVKCTLIYQGGALPVLNRCRYQQVQIRLEGTAGNTTRYLGLMKALGLTVATEKVMAAVQSGRLPLSQRPLPPPLMNTGQHYQNLAIWAGSLAAVTVLLIAALWYGMIVYPENVVLQASPARPLVKTAVYDAMPALPADLAVDYDQHLANQEVLITTTGWVDQANNIAHIPVADAMQIMLEQGAFPQAAAGN